MLIDDLEEKKSKKFLTVKVKIEEELLNKLREICKHKDVKEEDYLSAIIEHSEIEKAYKTLLREEVKKHDSSNQQE